MSTTRSQGEHSLALASSWWGEIVSVPLSGVGDVDDTLRLQVQLPAAAGWGEVRAIIQLPSAGEYWTDLGGASLVGIAPGTFTELSWPLSQSLRAKLEGSYTDLVVRIQVNAPPGTYLLDDLRFGQEQAETGQWLVPNLPGEIGFNARAWVYGYVYPRSYPLLDSDVVAANRHAAIADLREQRAARGYVHIGEEGLPEDSPSEPPGGGCRQGDCPDGYCQLCAPGTGGETAECTCQPAGTGGAGTGGAAATGGAGATGSGGTSTGGASSRVGTCGWTHAGPTNVPGRVISLSIDPVDPNVIYAGTVGGLYESTTAGRRWRRVSDHQFTDRIGAVAVWGSEVLVGPGDGAQGVTASTSGGPPHPLKADEYGIWKYESGTPGTWTRVSPPELDTVVTYNITFANATTAYAATGAGVYEGILSGGTWTFSSMGIPVDPVSGTPREFRDLEIDRTASPIVIYAAETAPGRAAVWKYSGGAWAEVSSGLNVLPGSGVGVKGTDPGYSGPDGNRVRIELALSGQGATTGGPQQILYARAWTGFWGEHVQLFRTDTAGEPPAAVGDAWIELPTVMGGSTGQYTRLLKVDPNDAGHLYYGEIKLWESFNADDPNPAAVTWGATSLRCGSEHEDCDTREYQRLHDDQHDLAFDPANPGVIWVGCDGGVFRSTPRGAPGSPWGWEFRSHGMRSSEFFTIAAGTKVAGLATGGLQDQGTQMTFGNRTWYTIVGGDGRYVAVDAANPLTIYASDQYHWPYMTLEPVPYVSLPQPIAPANLRATGNNGFWRVDGALADFGIRADPTVPVPATPVVADPTIGGVAFAFNRRLFQVDPLSVFGWLPDPEVPPLGLIRTTDGVDWTTVLRPGESGLPAESDFVLRSNWPQGQHKLVISATPNALHNRKSVYAWTGEYDPTYKRTLLGQTIFASHEGGDAGSWFAMGPLPASLPNKVTALAVDPNDALHVLAVTNTGLLHRSVDGQSWSPVTVSGAFPVNPGAIPLVAVAIDPADSTVFYVASDVGVFRGVFQGDGSVVWEEFSDGMPDFVSVTDLWLNPLTHALHASTLGYGVYRYDLDRGPICDAERLLVRDNVFDHGQEPSPYGLPDPEHPIVDSPRSTVDPTRFLFFKPNDDLGGQVYWWDSTDIRVDIPDLRDANNQITDADNYEFESCPVEVWDCFPGTMVDSGLQRPATGTLDANVYVQATQLGLGAVPDVRGAVLTTDATVEVPPLPADFWTATLPAGTAACGTLNDPTGRWQLLWGCGPFDHPVSSAVPEVKQFSWQVSATGPDHQCLLAVVDSPGDPVPDEIRNAGGRTEDIVQQSRHVAQRNLYVIDPPGDLAVPSGGEGVHGLLAGPYSGLTWTWVPNYAAEAAVKDVVVSVSGMADGRVSFLLPEGMAEVVPDLPEPCGQTPSLPGSAGALALPRALAEGFVALGATERLWVGDQTRIEQLGGAFSEVENMGSAATEIGAGAKVGSVTSVASVFLRSNATVEGDVITEGTITKQDDVTVSGLETAAADLPPASTITWPGPPTGASQGPVMLEPGTTRTLTPGAYGQVSVKTGATLTLEGGVYRFGSLDALEPGSVLVANTDAEPVVLYVEGSVTVRGAIVDTAMDGSGVLIVMLGTGWATLESPFHGTLVAPNGTISLGTAGGAPHLGSFFGREVVVAANAIVRQIRFTGFASVGACAPLTPEEVTRALELGLDPDAVYPVGGAERHVLLPVGADDRVKLGLRYEAGAAPFHTAERFRVLSMDGATVLGGGTYVLRH